MNISLSSIKRNLAQFIGRFHVVMFVVVVLGGLAIVVLLLNNIILTSNESNGYTSDVNSANFDQTTIDRIDQLKTRDEAGDQLDLSDGRTNPFVE
jgi:hypothetical protein